MNERLKISIVLKSIRGILGLSQAGLAELVDVPRSTITRAESLRLPLKVDVLSKIICVVEEKGIVFDMLSDEPTFKLTTHFMENEYAKLPKDQ
jgi:DNA-binding XRE family transcriptional regulator